MTIEQNIDDCDLGEMLYVTTVCKQEKFPFVQMDPQVQIDIISELISHRAEAKERACK